MGKHPKSLVLAGALLLLAAPAFAGLKDIRTDKLPQQEAVLKAYADVLTVEDFVREWSDQWNYPAPKARVVAVLSSSLAEWRKALEATPQNVELLLLTGLVAHYAYNVDVEGSFDIAVTSLENAHKLAPEDPRAEWFLGIHKCESNLSKEGMEAFLAIERSSALGGMPTAFWDDYITCATLTLMPAHALRAGDHLKRLKVAPSEHRQFLLETAKGRYKALDLKATYPAREVWAGDKVGSNVVFTSYLFGLEFSIPPNWRVDIRDVQQGFGLIQLETGPHPGKVGPVSPSILVIVRQARAGESLEQFLSAVTSKFTPRQGSVGACPSEGCLTFEGFKQGAYKSEGDGQAIVTVFKRETPEFPGLLFEQPSAPPTAEQEKTSSFHPIERFSRLQGTLYYLILLDSASSVLDKARIEYEAFVKTIRVE